MRKATGKVVSLVLALALVITSFSATFASAATTSEAGTVSGSKDTIYLSNLSNLEGSALTAAKAETAGQDRFDLGELIGVSTNSISMVTKDHMTAQDVQITSFSLSGDSVIKIQQEGSGDNKTYTAILRSDNAKGTAYVNVLYTGKVTRDDGVESTVRGTKKYTIVVLDAKTPIISGAATVGSGMEASAIGALQKNPQLNDGATDYDLKKDAEKPVTYNTAYVYVPSTSSSDTTYNVSGAGGSAVVTYTTPTIIDGTDLEDGGTYDGTVKVADTTTPVYAITVSGSNSYLDSNSFTDAVIDDNDGFKYGVADPVVGNTVRVTVSEVNKVTEEEESYDYYSVGKKVVDASSKVENKVSGKIASVALGDGSRKTVGLDSNVVLSKSKLYAQILVNSQPVYWDVNAGSVVQEDTANGLSITDGKLANVNAGSKDLTLTDVTVTGTAAGANVTVNGGSVGAIDGTTASVYEGAVVGSADAGTVNVYNGKISGDVTGATAVLVRAESDEATASVGTVKVAADGILTVDGTLGASVAGGFVANGTNDTGSSAKVVLMGDEASIGSINDNFWGSTVELNGFVGTIPAISNGEDTETGFNGATLTSVDSDEDTNATVSGALNIGTIDLNGGAVKFNSSVYVNEVLGGEADFIINAGALRVIDTISTANTLKIANAADVVVDKPVYYTTPDIGDVDDFQHFGFDLKVVTGGTYDAYLISNVEFAGLVLDQTSVEIVKGESAIITASTYPNGTKLPEGAKIAFYYNGVETYTKGYAISDTQAQIDALDYNDEFSVLNEGTLTAVVEDEYKIQLEEYGEAKATVKVVAQKAPTETYKSDTTGDVVVAKGNTYQFKITSLNGQTPSVVLGSDDVFELVGTSVEGSDYFFKFQAVGASGAATGVYVNGDAKVATLYVDGNTGYTCDTTTVNVPAGGTYQVKITAASMPTLLPGNSIYTVAFASQEGNDYFFKITATSAQAGDVVGFYINGGARAFVATTV